MARLALSHHEAYGDAIVERLAGAPIPALMKTSAAAFKAAHAALNSGSASASSARDVRDEALHAIGAADAELDAAVDALANDLVTAKLGTRLNPFKGFSKHAPGDLHRLGYQAHLKAVRDLVKQISKKKGAPTASLKTVTKRADALAAALKGLAKPQSKSHLEIVARDAELVDWQKKLTRLRTMAAAAWIDAPEKVTALFEAPEGVVVPAAKPRATKGKGKGTGKGKGANPGAPTPPATGTTTT
jgi:hypothetical protein